VPFDFGYLAFVYDSLRTSPPPKATLGEFPGMLGNQKVVIQDPRTSTLGIELLIWTGSKLEEQFETFWKGLAPRILTISPGWSGAYELFLKKQVDYVLSYTTSPAYHRIRENKENIKALLFADGHFRQVEGLAVLKSSNQKVLAKKFIELVLEKEIQESIPTLQWMYPARSGANLPKEFRDIPVPTKVSMDWNKITAHRDEWTKLWTLILSREKK
ncbi:MAG: thiamine ABC transporter substrate-binding protein, partial [Proteobacteria bacterium]|nr:thiamine ABC transporter substrate-binding protein [Pseudomonadota bacterium]